MVITVTFKTESFVHSLIKNLLIIYNTKIPPYIIYFLIIWFTFDMRHNM